MQFFNVGGVGGLLALHCSNDDLVAELQLGHIGGLVGLSFGELQALGEEVVENLLLDCLSVGFFVGDPTGQLVGVFGWVLGKFDDLLRGFFDCFEVGVHGLDDIVVIVNAAGDLAVGGDCRGS